MQRLTLLTIAFLMSCLPAALSAADATAPKPPSEEYDLWYSIIMQDRPCGWEHRICKRVGQNLVQNEEMSIGFARGPVNITLLMESEFVETLDGKPVSYRQKQTFGAMPSLTRMTFTPNGIDVETEQAGQKNKSQLPLPEGKWLCPAAAERYAAEQFHNGAKQIKFTTINPELNMRAAEIGMKIGDRKNIEVMGKTVPATQVKMTMSLLPNLLATSYVDDDARDLKSEIEFIPGMKMVLLRADKDLAQKQVNPPDFMKIMLLHPDKPIAQPRTRRHAQFDVNIVRENANAENGKSVELPAGDAQTVVWKDASHASATVTVDLDAPGNAKDQPGPADRAACAMLDCNDPKVKELARQALIGKEKAPAAEKAEILRQFVHNFIKSKDLSVGFATASETARTAEGDCTEHAVLLAALLRVEQIPSRCVSGLIYADSFLGQDAIFGYHMWARAFLADAKHPAGRWVDLDATLEVPFDATHIALGVSDMSEGAQGNDMVKLSQVLGRVQIRVIEVK